MEVPKNGWFGSTPILGPPQIAPQKSVPLQADSEVSPRTTQWTFSAFSDPVVDGISPPIYIYIYIYIYNVCMYVYIYIYGLFPTCFAHLLSGMHRNFGSQQLRNEKVVKVSLQDRADSGGNMMSK